MRSKPKSTPSSSALARAKSKPAAPSREKRLPRSRFLLTERVLQHISECEFLASGDRVAVAVSGGADSVALLRLLLDLRAKLGIVLSVAHFNHQLRGRASDADEKFVAQLAAKFALPLHRSRGDVATQAKREKSNLEETARRARYSFFAKLVADGLATHVVVGHTADDQAETVLAHILRGTGLAGLGGIHPVNEHVVRPLLPFRRAELRAYLRSAKQNWREDASNRDTSKTRARIRKKLLPLLAKQFQRHIVEHLYSLAELAREDEAFLESQAELRAMMLVKRLKNTAMLQVSDLLRRPADKLPEPVPADLGLKMQAVNKRLLRRIIHDVKRRPGQINAEHIQAVLALVERGENGQSLPLPGGIEVLRDNNTLIFRPQSFSQDCAGETHASGKQFEFPLTLPSSPSGVVAQAVPCLASLFRLTVIDWPAKTRETIDTGSVLDRHALRAPLVLRNWRPGDKFRPLGRHNAHKLKRLLNKKRIGRWARDGWPVLTSGGVLAWARGFPVAAEFAASERTQTGIVIAEEPLS